MKYHIEEVQVPRGSDSPLDLGESRRIVHVVSQVPSEDAGGLDTLHVLVENDGSADDPRGYENSGPGANMGAPQPAGPVSDEDAELAERADGGNPDDLEAADRSAVRDDDIPGDKDYPANPVPGEDAAPVEPEDTEAETTPAWTSEDSEYEPGFERTDPDDGDGQVAESNRPASEDGDQAGRVVDSGPADDGQNQRERGWRGRGRNRNARDE